MTIHPRVIFYPLKLVKIEHQSPHPSVTVTSSVRESFATRKAKMIDRDQIFSSLMAWQCDSSCSVDCIRTIIGNDLKRSALLNIVFALRKTTFKRKEQEIKHHCAHVVNSCLRLSNLHLQFVVGGLKVCKAVFMALPHRRSIGSMHCATKIMPLQIRSRRQVLQRPDQWTEPWLSDTYG